jgi:hypothetical protein
MRTELKSTQAWIQAFCIGILTNRSPGSLFQVLPDAILHENALVRKFKEVSSGNPVVNPHEAQATEEVSQFLLG